MLQGSFKIGGIPASIICRVARIAEAGREGAQKPCWSIKLQGQRTAAAKIWATTWHLRSPVKDTGKKRTLIVERRKPKVPVLDARPIGGMRLYSGTVTGFIDDNVHNRIADKLKAAFFGSFRFDPGPAEVNSWRNSLRAASQLFQQGKLNDHGLCLEYQLPMTSKRLDCIVTGRNEVLRDQAVIMELKQWETCEEADGDRVVTFVAGAHREVLHPSVQVGQYQQYLEDCHTAFHEGEDRVGLKSCAYLHNYNYADSDPLKASKFAPYTERYPLFTADDVDPLVEYLNRYLCRGDGLHVLHRVEKSRYRPSKKLLDHVAGILDGKKEYVLLDEQLVAFDRVLASAQQGFRDRKKAIILIRGGPGTGKSVIALNILAELSRRGLNTHYVTGSRAFTTTLRKIVGSRADCQVNFFGNYAKADYNDIDVMVCDEAHRLARKNKIMYQKWSGKEQIEELLHAAKVSVFFIDDKQNVRPDEIGSSEYIQSKARQLSCKFFDYRLEAQFRCAGSDGFVNWVANTLGIERTANVLWNFNEGFDFKIFGSPAELESEIKSKLAEGATGRLCAGFCWDWSKARSDGTLVDDVVIGDFHRPWNARPESTRLARGIPKAPLWAYDPNGMGQVGCVYTAQGFEFDYVGVIIGLDLVYRPQVGWVGMPEHSFDRVVKKSRDRFTDLVKNTYRVLLSRGLKGCYVYFMDQQTRDFFLSRTERTNV